MRLDLRPTLNGLNDEGLQIAKTFLDGLAQLPEFRRIAEPTAPPFTLVPTPQPSSASTFVSRAREPYFLVDHRMDVIAVSTALQRVLGATAYDLLGRRWERLVDGADELRLVHQKWLISAQTHHGFTHTTRCRTPKGAIVFLFMKVEPYEAPDTGRFGGFFGAVRVQPVPLTLLHSESA